MLHSEKFFFFAANFPWLEPLVLHVIGSTDVAASAKLMYTIAVGLIEARIKSKEPPKVLYIVIFMMWWLYILCTIGEGSVAVNVRCNGRK